jgi:hypothetical protein
MICDLGHHSGSGHCWRHRGHRDRAIGRGLRNEQGPHTTVPVVWTGSGEE